jgi:hypothetical protein
VPEVGGSDCIGFFSSGYDHKCVTTGIRSGMDWSGRTDYWNKDLFYSDVIKMENMEFLKAMLAKMKAKTDATKENMKTDQEKEDANARKGGRKSKGTKGRHRTLPSQVRG